MQLTTNDSPKRWTGNFFTLKYQRNTKSLLENYLLLNED